MNIIAERETSFYSLMALSEGLDFPNRRVVSITSDNPLLKYMAPVEELEGSWDVLARWIESHSSSEERLHQLQTAYYQMFLQSETALPVYLHLWYPNESPAAFLGELQSSLQKMQLAQSPGWQNGSDHLSVILEATAHLVSMESTGLLPFTDRFILPWFSTFVRGLEEKASNDFYVAMAMIAREVNHALETLT